MSDKIEPGSVVHLKSGGHLMTVVSKAESRLRGGECVECAYVAADGTVAFATLATVALRLYKGEGYETVSA